MHADSKNTPIQVGDRVRWAGSVYTIKAFVSASKIAFEEIDIVVSEWSVDLTE